MTSRGRDCGRQGLEHNVIIKKTTGVNWCQRVWHLNTRKWVSTSSYSPAYRAYTGIRYATTL